jgi:glutathione-specific gamma-glutamylcyclotransferase
MPRTLSLTSDLVAVVDRVVPEVGREPGLKPLADDEYRRLAAAIMQEANGALHIFAFGSLAWKPQTGFTPLGKVRAYGWRRSFCLNLTTFRGTPDQPGLMLALDYGGCCDGVLVRADQGIELDGVEALLRREVDYVEDVPYVRWITVQNGNKKVRALTFYAAPRGDGLAVHLSIEEQASRIARAAGSAGTCAAYLRNTVVKLMEHGINDAYLWKLQALVAQEIQAMQPTGTR